MAGECFGILVARDIFMGVYGREICHYDEACDYAWALSPVDWERSLSRIIQRCAR